VLPPTIPPLDEKDWNLLPAGVQWRTLSFQTSYGTVGVLVARIDPTRVRFKVHYSPGRPRSIRDWQLALSSAVAIVNANFFDPAGNVIGLLSADGVLYGSSLTRADASMFQVLGGVSRVRYLYQEPYQNWERFEQAVQGFPTLMAFQQVAPSFDRALSQTADRRTVIAQDVRGRILFIVTQYSNVTFTDLANWLGRSGLEIHTAVCMDGGNSSSLYLATGGPSQFTAGLSGIPAVLAVYPR
jgi:exopolysaccharide biosynthesis protein